MQFSHLGELAEHKGFVADPQHLFQHFGEARQLAGTAGDGGVISEEMRRMVADLLQFGESRQYYAFAPDALGGFEVFFVFLNHRGVERRLLFCQRTENLHFHLVWQICDDRLVRFEPPQDEWSGNTLKALSGLRVPLRLNRRKEFLFELRLASQKSRIEEFHNRPQIPYIVLTGVPVKAIR